MPKEKQPPDDIWDDNYELEIWFDKVFDRKGTGNPKTHAVLNINEDEIEG